jgi:hypothetical protein
MNDTRHFPWKTAIIAFTVIALALIAAWLLLAPSRAVKTIAEKFQTGHITTAFIEDIPAVTSTHGDILELATLTSTETFSREESTTLAWGYLPTSTTTAEIRVPATFRYHLKLSGTWRLATRGNVCVVLAPPIEPSLPPAIDTARMEKNAASGWASFDKNAMLDGLEKDITRHLSKRAGNPKHIDLVREQCRRSVADFVQKWLVKNSQWPEKLNAIIVVFPDEKQFNNDDALSGLSAAPIIQYKKE